MSLYPVLLAGGAGTRFWPQSRQCRPKQLLPLTGGAPLVVETFRRLGALAAPERTLVVCGRAHADPIRRLLPELPAMNTLVEPAARNTAPCIALAAAVVAARDPEGVLAVLPSDHHVADVAGFQKALRLAEQVAEGDRLVTLGIAPTRPETGFGYIERGEALRGAEGAYEVRRFVEKPDPETAGRYVASGRFLWNAGIFVFRAERYLRAFAEHLPDSAAILDDLRGAIGTPDFERALALHFPRMAAISIDYGVMEKARDIAVIPADVGWSDVGSFPALAEVRETDADGNVVEGDAVLLDAKDCVVLAGNKPLALLGVEGLIVVDAGDVTLVCSKSRAQDVRQIVELFRRQGRTGLL